jgi:hypothetical protein
MHPIIYDVAVSIVGYISVPDGDVSVFAHEGAVVDDCRACLTRYSCALMGRKIYEVGYQSGMKTDQNYMRRCAAWWSQSPLRSREKRRGGLVPHHPRAD